MHVTLALFGLGEFTHSAQEWFDLTMLAQDAFDWRPLRFVHGTSRVSRGPREKPVSMKAFDSISTGFATGRLDAAWIIERSAKESAQSPDPPNVAFLTVEHHGRSTTAAIDDAPNVLPCSVSMKAEVSSAWPASKHLVVLRQLARLTRAQYGCVYVGADHEQAISERSLVVTRDWKRPDPEWGPEIHRLARWRHLFGEKVRAAYWGNFLSQPLVNAIGGTDALRATGASTVEHIPGGLTYVQLTPTVGEALGEAGVERLSKLKTLLAPISV